MREETNDIESISWERIIELTKTLARDIESANYTPDIIFAIVRGGWIPSRLLADYLDIEELGSIFLTREKKYARSLNTPRDKRILIVDDIADTGISLDAALRFVNFNKPKEVKTATLYYKLTSTILPTWFAEETESWIIFPWEEYSWRRKQGEKIVFGGENLC